MADAIFIRERNGRLVATDLARGPWDPDAQHGGPPAALLIQAFEQVPNPDELALARVTYDLLRPVPLSPLDVHAEPARTGRRVQLLEGSIRDQRGETLVRARALRVRRSDANIPATALASPPERPARAKPFDYPGVGKRFATHAMEIRFVEGSFLDPGPATAWFCLRHPLIEGERPSPMQLLAAVADFGNGISTVLSWEEYVFINPDLTLHIEREPVGDWVCVEAETRLQPEGIGAAESTLYDETGRVGRAFQALLVGVRSRR